MENSPAGTLGTYQSYKGPDYFRLEMVEN